MVIPNVPREPLSTQEMVGGDNNRTPAKFRAPDIYRFVGGIFITAWVTGRLCSGAEKPVLVDPKVITCWDLFKIYFESSQSVFGWRQGRNIQHVKLNGYE